MRNNKAKVINIAVIKPVNIIGLISTKTVDSVDLNAKIAWEKVNKMRKILQAESINFLTTALS